MVEVAIGALAAGLVGYPIYAGERQASSQRKGLRLQQQAEREAEGRALSEQRRADQDENRARQKTPDLDILLGDQLVKPSRRQSIDANRLLLGRPGLLGY